ncbi:hypothetical protein F9S83_26215 [Escherichia coli]|nr:hypothetical protein [Escherichia coli]EFN4501865.1 hypothetical protein [Escherichia coli]HAG7414379.1 hypothetical protein [Escherichia coli]
MKPASQGFHHRRCLPLCTDLILIIIVRRSVKSQYDRHIDRYNTNMQIFVLLNIVKTAYCKTYNHD